MGKISHSVSLGALQMHTETYVCTYYTRAQLKRLKYVGVISAGNNTWYKRCENLEVEGHRFRDLSSKSKIGFMTRGGAFNDVEVMTPCRYGRNTLIITHRVLRKNGSLQVCRNVSINLRVAEAEVYAKSFRSVAAQRDCWGTLPRYNQFRLSNTLLRFVFLYRIYRFYKDSGLEPSAYFFHLRFYTVSLTLLTFQKSTRKIQIYDLIWWCVLILQGFINVSQRPLRDHQDICGIFHRLLKVSTISTRQDSKEVS